MVNSAGWVMKCEACEEKWKWKSCANANVDFSSRWWVEKKIQFGESTRRLAAVNNCKRSVKGKIVQIASFDGETFQNWCYSETSITDLIRASRWSARQTCFVYATENSEHLIIIDLIRAQRSFSFTQLKNIESFFDEDVHRIDLFPAASQSCWTNEILDFKSHQLCNFYFTKLKNVGRLSWCSRCSLISSAH